MKNHRLNCYAEIYRLLPVIGILLLALLGIWWGSRTAAVNKTVQPPDLRTGADFRSGELMSETLDKRLLRRSAR